MTKENKILKENEVIERIGKLVNEVGYDDRDRERLLNWEGRAKQALIKLSLDGHEGVKLLKDVARTEIMAIRYTLLTRSPMESISKDSAIGFAYDTALLQDRLALWQRFLGFFDEANEDLKEVISSLDLEDKENENLKTNEDA